MISKIVLPSIRHIFAVVSGKGGVGKSTFSYFFSSILAKKGLKIGLLDADIYGPSIPKLTGIQNTKPQIKNKKFVPFVKNDVKIMSMGFLLEDTAPVMWRGPMVQTAVKQLFQDVDWGDLDALIVDMPPGTGDAHLTLAQSIPLTGVLVITTPQNLAAIDAVKCLHMYKKLNIPVLGVIDNMKVLTCTYCNHEIDVFPGNAGYDMAQQFDVPYLGSIPFDTSIVHITETSGSMDNLSDQVYKSYENLINRLKFF